MNKIFITKFLIYQIPFFITYVILNPEMTSINYWFLIIFECYIKRTKINNRTVIFILLLLIHILLIIISYFIITIISLSSLSV